MHVHFAPPASSPRLLIRPIPEKKQPRSSLTTPHVLGASRQCLFRPLARTDVAGDLGSADDLARRYSVPRRRKPMPKTKKGSAETEAVQDMQKLYAHAYATRPTVGGYC
jgi:hypothetical protein